MLGDSNTLNHLKNLTSIVSRRIPFYLISRVGAWLEALISLTIWGELNNEGKSGLSSSQDIKGKEQVWIYQW